MGSGGGRPHPADQGPVRFTADAGDARHRLDVTLVRRLRTAAAVTRTLAQRWIREDRVRVDGRLRTRPSDGVPAGSVVDVDVPPEARRAVVTAEPGQLDLLYEDEHIIAVNKPAGVVVHPTYKHIEGTLLSTILWHVHDRPDVAPGIVSRLDKDTSGVLLVALSPAVHAQFQRDAASGRVRKEYLAVVYGVPRPRTGTVSLPLARDLNDRRRVVVDAHGQHSETRYEVIDERGELSVVRCELVTGRTHQIRVHLAASGWPIAGDPVYGRPHPLIGRQALHATRTSFRHPVSGAAIEIAAPLAADIERVIGEVRLDAAATTPP